MRPATDGVRNQVAIEGGKLAAMGLRQGQQECVGHLAGVEQTRTVDSPGIEESHIVGPELMAANRTEDGEQLSDSIGRSRRIGITRMADNP